jgi:hypothetical protein
MKAVVHSVSYIIILYPVIGFVLFVFACQSHSKTTVFSRKNTPGNNYYNPADTLVIRKLTAEQKGLCECTEGIFRSRDSLFTPSFLDSLAEQLNRSKVASLKLSDTTSAVDERCTNLTDIEASAIIYKSRYVVPENFLK